MKLQVITLQDAPWPELVERWHRLEELGVQTIWVADHLGTSQHEHWQEAWTCIATLAHVTSAPRIGPLVSPMNLRNPAVLARTAISVADLTGGRLELGIGAGGSTFDHELTQVPKWEAKERAALFEGWVERLAELLGHEHLHRRHPIPLTIAGRGKTILRVASRYADRWNTFGGFGKSPEEALETARADLARLDELCAESGRTVTRSIMLGYPFVSQTLWGSDEEFAEVVERWENAGFDELVVYYPAEWGMPDGSVTPGVFERALEG